MVLLWTHMRLDVDDTHFPAVYHLLDGIHTGAVEMPLELSVLQKPLGAVNSQL